MGIFLPMKVTLRTKYTALSANNRKTNSSNGIGDMSIKKTKH